MSETNVGEKVLEFYKELPFNLSESPELSAMMIRDYNNVEYIYPQTDDLYSVQDVLEVGCGAGWLSNSLAYWYNLKVTAIDFNPVAIAFAKRTAELLGVDVEFHCADLFSYSCASKDIVIANGVLHHTGNTERGIKKCIDLTQRGGKVFIGLYNKYGRKAFLDYFDVLKQENKDEKFLLAKYLELDKRYRDKIQGKSWFRDQVLHPYESQHTLKEVVDIFERNNVQLLKTSINLYGKIDNIEDIYQEELKLYDKGVECIERHEYFPGFFYVLGEKR